MDKETNCCKGKLANEGGITHRLSLPPLSLSLPPPLSLSFSLPPSPSLFLSLSLPLSLSGSGYGFVDFENPADALRAVQSLQNAGVMAQFAKVPQVPSHTHQITRL